MTTPILIDCDPGHDDAIALLLALASPEVEVLGVTSVAGNQTLDKTTANALRVLEFVGRGDVPVAAGADRPLIREQFVAAYVHGETGLDGPDLPPPQGEPVDKHAVDFLAETIRNSDRPVTLIPVGPLTNDTLAGSLAATCFSNWFKWATRASSAAGAADTAQDNSAAQAAIDEGRRIGAKTERERGYIEAVAAYYADFATRSERDRQLARAKAYEALAAKYPYQRAYLPVNRKLDGTMHSW